MALKNLNFDVSINGIMPNIVTDAGTQGDHGVTRLNFMLTEEIYQEVINTVMDGKVMYRFDLYDGEGGLWQSEALALVGRDVGITLQERHTRFGGKLIVYLIITALSSNNKTEVELYNSPIMLKLKNRPNGVFKDGENYESVTSLAENAKQHVLLAAEFAEASKEYNDQTREFVEFVEEKLKNGEFDGVGIKSAEIVNGELIITYSNGNSQNLGNVVGQDGDSVDLNNFYTKDDINEFDYANKKYVDQAVANVATSGSVDLSNYYTKSEVDTYHNRVTLQQQTIIKNFENYYTKTDVDTAINQKQDTLSSGENIKTINGESILGEGNITIEGGTGESIKVDQYYKPESENAQSGVAVLQAISTKADADWIELSNPFTVEHYLFEDGTYTGVVSGVVDAGDGVRVFFYPNAESGGKTWMLEEWCDSSKTPPTVEDFYNIGIEVGKTYRFVIKDNYVISIKRCSALSEYYTKTEVDTILEDIEAGTVDLSNYYTKTEVDNAIAEVSGGECGSMTVDLSYSATSENAQSGKAVAEAIVNKVDNVFLPLPKFFNNNQTVDDGTYTGVITAINVSGMQISITLNTGKSSVMFVNFDVTGATTVEDVENAGFKVGETYQFVVENSYIASVGRYATLNDYYTKTEIDTKIGDIESLLGGI